MPVYDDQKTEADNDELSRITGIDPDEERMMERNARAGAAEDSSSDPDSFSPEDITDRESSGGGGNSLYRADKNEASSLAGLSAKSDDKKKQKDDATHNDDSEGKPSSRLDKAKAAVKGLAANRNVRIGGGVGGFIVFIATMLGLFGFQFQMVNFRDNGIFRANKVVNQALANRRVASTYKSIDKVNKGKLKGVTVTQVAEMLRDEGFVVDLKDDKITKLSFTAEDRNGKKVTKSVDLDKFGAKRNFTKMFDSSEVGRMAALSLDKAAGGKGATFKGPEPMKRLAKIVKFRNWLDRKPSDKAESKQAKYVDNLRHAEMEGTGGATVDRLKTQEELDEEAKKNGTTPEKVSDNAAVIEAIADYQEELLNDPNFDGTPPTAGDTDAMVKAVSDAGGDIEKAIAADTSGILKRAISKAVLSSLNAFGAIGTACTINGTLKFFSNVAPVLTSRNLEIFAMLMMMAADNQSAGITTAAGVGLLAHALNRMNPDTGKSASHSQAIRSFFFGEQGVPQSPYSLSTLSISRRPQGLIGQASALMNSIVAAIGGQGTCKVANNGFVQVGGLIVGLGAAFFSGGTLNAGQAAGNITLQVAGSLAISIGEQMIMKSLVGAVVNGWEYGDYQGDAWAVGWENARNQNANVNGLVAATKETAAALGADADINDRIAQSQKSLYERYLNPHDGRSALVTTASMAMPYYSNPGLMASTLVRNISSMPGNALNLFTGKASAATIREPLCDDPTHPLVRKYQLQVNQYCVIENAYSPNLDNDETEEVLRNAKQIDDDGQVIGGSEFEDYINMCLVGNIPQQYNPEVDKDGTNDIGLRFNYQIGGGREKDPCVEPVKGKPLPGDGVGRFERYRQWNAYIRIDEPNFVQKATDTYGPAAGEVVTYFQDLDDAATQNTPRHTVFSDIAGSFQAIRTTFKKLSNEQLSGAPDSTQPFNGLWQWSIR